MRCLIFLVSAFAAVSFGACASTQQCMSVPAILRKGETCLDYAKAANPVAFVSFANRTCMLYKVCNITAPKTAREFRNMTNPCVSLTDGEVNLNQAESAIIVKTSTMPISKSCPKFDKVIAKTKPLLLLRTHASFGESPYRLLFEGELSPRQMTVDEVKKNKKPFKSPLLTIPSLSTMKSVQVELLDDKAKRVVKLLFSYKPEDKFEEGKWFAKDRLIQSYPWPLSTLRKRTFSVFSIHGNKARRNSAQRRFEAIFTDERRGCNYYQGIMAVVEKAACSWEMNNKYFPAYLYSNRNIGHWRSYKKEASEFRILGFFNQNSEVYLRKSQKC